MDLKDVYLNMDKDEIRRVQSTFVGEQMNPIRNQLVKMKKEIEHEDEQRLKEIEERRKSQYERKFIDPKKLDDMDKQISRSTLVFGNYYIMNRQENRDDTEKKSQYIDTHRFDDHALDTKGRLIETEKSPALPKDNDKYLGKEKEYGLGDYPFHEWTNQEMCDHFGNDINNGFDDSKHSELQKKYGLNRITPKKTQPWIVKLILNMLGGFQIFLWIGGILCIIVYIITKFVDYQTLALGILCFAVVIGTSLFQTYQEGKSNDVMAALRALTPENVYVLRNGHFVEKPCLDLVPGDIIKVKKNEKVPADLRVIKSDKLKVNNASLTGENVDINLNPTTDAKTLYEAKNIARMGCNFTNGEGICMVFSTGDHTFFGHIAKSTLNIKRPDSCLTKEIKRLVHIMGAIAVTIGIIFLILAILRGYKEVEAIVFMIGIIVANVPEGLLPQMTVALTLTAKKMQKKDVVVTNLEIIETLGAVSVICSDKTGTLTCNRMTVSHFSYDMNIFGIKKEKEDENDLHYEIIDDIFELNDNIHEINRIKNMYVETTFDEKNDSFQQLLKIMILGSNARFESDKDKDKNVLDRAVVNGDASEAALIKFSNPVYDINEYRSQYNVVHEIPFNSNNKWMLKILQSISNPNENEGRYTYYMKGAPEKVMDFCKFFLYKGKIYPMEKEHLVKFLCLNERLAFEGERVLAFAYKIANRTYPSGYDFGEEGAKTNKFDFNDFIFAGLTSLQDPPRVGVKESIQKCYQAGIRVFMVTGDQPATALSIAKQLGLVTCPGEDESDIQTKNNKKDRKNAELRPNSNTEMNNLNYNQNIENPNLDLEAQEALNNSKKSIAKKRIGWTIPKHKVVNGVDLLNYTQDDWDYIFSFKEVVFARTMPQQKQDIVNQLRDKNEIIAMTGDGVNDAPALKAAHVGIAMGSGASVAKEAGQLILLKDDFSNIVDGIQEGRLIFENLKKCICYVLASNIPELIPFLLFIIIKIPLSIETIMIILIDVGTDLAPAVSLAWEIEENETMKMPPRGLNDHLVGFKLMFMAYIVIGLIQTFASYWAWAWVYYDHGFSISDLIGAGIEYREKWDITSEEQKKFFYDMCVNNKWYQINRVQALGKDCKQDFKDWMVDLLAISQSAFLMTVVWAQLACIFVRKTQCESIFSWKRITNNKPLFWAILIEIIIIIIVIYIPGLNNALLLTHVPPVYASTALWVIPLIFLVEEIRKYLIRISPNGCLASTTKF